MRKIWRNFDTLGSTGDFKGFRGRFPAQRSTVICVHPAGYSSAILLRHSGKRTTFLEPATNHAVSILVAAALTAGEWMAVVAVCPAAASWGMLQTLTVGELYAVVHGDALENMPEVRAALQVIQHGHHGSSILTRDFEDQFHARQPFRHDNDGFTLPLFLAYDAIHLPMAESGTIRNDLRSMLNTGTISGLLLIRIISRILLPRVLTDTMLRKIGGPRIQQAAPEIPVDRILAEIAQIRAAQRRRYPCRGAAFYFDMPGYVGEQRTVSSCL